MIIIAVNNTNNPIILDNLLIQDRTIPPNGTVTLTTHNTVFSIQSDPQLLGLIESGQITLNDGHRDLNLTEALSVATPVVSSASIYNFNEAPEKVKVVGTDLFITEDSEDNYKKKKVQAQNVIFVGEGTIIFSPEQKFSSDETMTKAKNPVPLEAMEITPGAGNYAVWFNFTFERVQGIETVYTALYTGDTLVPTSQRETPENSFFSSQYLVTGVPEDQPLRVFWWTERGRWVRALSRSLVVHRYI